VTGSTRRTTTVDCAYELRVNDVVPGSHESVKNSVDEPLSVDVEPFESRITPSHTAQVELTVSNTGTSTVHLSHLSTNAPEPLVSQSAIESFDEETGEYEEPVLVLVPESYGEVERAPDTCWEPERDGFDVQLALVQTAIDPGDSLVRSYEVWASPNDRQTGVQPGTYEFAEGFGRFTLNVEPDE